MITKIGMIAIGGAFGSVARYLINISPLGSIFDKFPFPTFLINILGSFLIGFCVFFFADRYDVGENVRMAVIVGFLGAFTTFSTFEMDLYGLLRERYFMTAFTYMLFSVVAGFVGLLVGVNLAKRI